MDTIVEYVERELATFAEKPVNAVDSLMLSQLSYLRLGETFPACRTVRGTFMRHLFRAECFDSLYRGQRDEEFNYRLLAALAASPRFRDVQVTSYVNIRDEKREMQFSAETFVFGDDDIFVVFRGTDSTLVGWKENFNMASMFPIPAQAAAADYLDAQAAAHTGALYVGGHSKGGNLAEYAAFKCKAATQNRLVAVHDHDGPGFAVDIFSTPSFKRVASRIHKTVPQSSIVGMLFDSIDGYQVVMSNGLGIMQHDPFTWSVDIENDDFFHDDDITLSASRSDRVLGEWIGSMDESQRVKFTDTMFDALQASGAKSFESSNIVFDPATLAAFNALREADPESRDTVLDTLGSLAKFAVTPSAKNDPAEKLSPEKMLGMKGPGGRPLLVTASDYFSQLKDAVVRNAADEARGEGRGEGSHGKDAPEELRGEGVEGEGVAAAPDTSLLDRITKAQMDRDAAMSSCRKEHESPHRRAHVIQMPELGGAVKGRGETAKDSGNAGDETERGGAGAAKDEGGCDGDES